MNAATLIQRLTDTGIHLSADGDRLHVEAPPGAITSELRDLLVNRKTELIEAMSGIRGHLLALAKSEGVDASLVYALPSGDVDACDGLDDAALTAYVLMLDDTATREAGKRPVSYTAKAMCRHCGPVWLSPDVLQGAPVIDGWPQVLGCPWCVVRAAERYIPRPTRRTEIDENLMRSELTATQQAEHLQRRKEIWEAMENQVVQAASPDSEVGYKQPPKQIKRFAAETSAATGVNKSTVTRATRRAREVCQEARDLIRGTSASNTNRRN
ncbi:MAG TPA: hypothetical protein VFJ15_14910 [Oleiagrimonas sp.]|nr:hypothetical protein [Oleiagrimonas sp.]